MTAYGVPDGLPVLSRGKHRSPRKGACFMEMASVLAASGGASASIVAAGACASSAGRPASRFAELETSERSASAEPASSPATSAHASPKAA